MVQPSVNAGGCTYLGPVSRFDRQEYRKTFLLPVLPAKKDSWGGPSYPQRRLQPRSQPMGRQDQRAAAHSRGMDAQPESPALVLEEIAEEGIGCGEATPASVRAATT